MNFLDNIKYYYQEFHIWSSRWISSWYPRNICQVNDCHNYTIYNQGKYCSSHQCIICFKQREENGLKSIYCQEHNKKFMIRQSK